MKSLSYASSADPAFDDIRPCYDHEVPGEIAKIIADRQLVDSIIRFSYPRLAHGCAWAARPLVRRALRRRLGRITTVREFQEQVAVFMRGMIATTTSGVDYHGFEALDPGQGYLFISNHRDISLDPAFIDMALYESGHDTVRIAIGDNLLRTQAATSLMRLNKSFIVRRAPAPRHEKLRELTKLSAYIGLSLRERHSVWIAQREGRAKNGDDKTEAAVLKMLYVYGRSLGLSFREYIASLNLVPVSITYEYDPGDLDKARELHAKETAGTYVKSELEDLLSIAGGIKGFKGHVSIVAGAPLREGFETPEELAALIDRFIYEHYRLYPSILLAARAQPEQRGPECDFFSRRLDSYPQELRGLVLSMYAMPYINLQKLKNGI